MKFVEKILSQIEKTKTQLCVGIDPPLDIENLSVSKSFPRFFLEQWKKIGHAGWIERYSYALIEAARGMVPGIKPQSAYFEAAGYQGLRVLEDILVKAKKYDLTTILDVKRGDISTTMTAYGHMAFETLNADSMTVTAYMGTDVILPLLPWIKRGKGLYIVWISSNVSGAQIQNLCASHLLHFLQKFSDENNLDQDLGLVYGVTKLEPSSKWSDSDLRKFYLLMPGIGPQGGKVTADLGEFLRSHTSALIPQSRAIGQLDLQSNEEEPRSWDDFSEIVSKRISHSKKQLKDVMSPLI